MMHLNDFNDYETEFTTLVETVRRDISKLRATFPDPSKPTPADAKPVTNRTEQWKVISQACLTLGVLLMHLKEAAKLSEKPELAALIKDHTDTLSSLMNERESIKRLCTTADSADLSRNATSTNQRAIKSAMCAKPTFRSGGGSDEASDKIHALTTARNNVRMQDSHRVLQECERELTRTNEVFSSTLDALDDQSKKSDIIDGTNVSISAELSQIHRVFQKLKNLLKHVIRSKILVFSGVVLLVIAFRWGYNEFPGTDGGGAAVAVHGPPEDDTNEPGPLDDTPAPFRIPTLPPDDDLR